MTASLTPEHIHSPRVRCHPSCPAYDALEDIRQLLEDGASRDGIRDVAEKAIARRERDGVVYNAERELMLRRAWKENVEQLRIEYRALLDKPIAEMQAELEAARAHYTAETEDLRLAFERANDLADQRAGELVTAEAETERLREARNEAREEAAAAVVEADQLRGLLTDIAIPCLRYGEEKCGHDDQARLNLEAGIRLAVPASTEEQK